MEGRSCDRWLWRVAAVGVVAVGGCAGTVRDPKSPRAAVDTECEELLDRFRRTPDVRERNRMYSDAPENCQRAMLGVSQHQRAEWSSHGVGAALVAVGLTLLGMTYMLAQAYPGTDSQRPPPARR